MPHRLISLAVIACWLATSGWLFYREIWPELRPNEAPPFTIDLADEAAIQGARIRWHVLRADQDGEHKIGRARTWVDYRAADDTFELHSELERLQLTKALKVPRMSSMYRVNRDGFLLEMKADVTATVSVFFVSTDIKTKVAGEVRDRLFWPRCQIETALWGKQDVAIKPVEVSSHGTVLNPLHPVNRISGLRPGQRWRMPLVDPLADALAARLSQEIPAANIGPRSLEAQVLPDLQSMTWYNDEVPCLVIQYRGDDMSARTWVRQKDGLVLRQEATRDDDTIILQREGW
jgi:hypothetical protein